MGVCCIVFDIDGMLFDFFCQFFFKIIYFLISAFYTISNIFKTKFKFLGGGGIN